MEKKQSPGLRSPGFGGQTDTAQSESFTTQCNKYYDGKNHKVQWESTLHNS